MGLAKRAAGPPKMPAMPPTFLTAPCEDFSVRKAQLLPRSSIAEQAYGNRSFLV